MRLNNIMSSVKPSATQATSAKAASLKAEGKDVISLALGEPDMLTPAHIIEAAKEALDQGKTKYTKVNGIEELREAIVGKYQKEHNISYDKNSEVIVTAGAKQAIATCFACILEEGDEVIIPAPYWTSYPSMVELAGGKSVIVNTTPESGYVATAKQIEEAITDKTKAVIINSPSNPTGGVYSEEDLKDIANLFKTHPRGSEILILSDEVYDYFTYGDTKHRSIVSFLPEMKDNILVANAFSKSYAMTGWRVGYALGGSWLIKAIAVHQSQFTSNVNSIAQCAASKAFEDNGEFPKKMLEKFESRRQLVMDRIDAIEGLSLSVPPKGAFYAFIRIEGIIGKTVAGKEITSSLDLCNLILETAHVALVAGEAFGDSAAMRLSFAQSEEEINKAFDRIETLLKS